MPTEPEFCCTTNCDVPIVRPPVEMVDVAVVDVALKLPKVGVLVPMTTPLPFVERREFRATDGRLNCPEMVEEAVEKKPERPRIVEVEL